MVAKSLPFDDEELEDEEIEGFLSTPSKRRNVASALRRQQTLSWPWFCLLCLLSFIALFLAVIAAMLWSHHHHSLKTDVNIPHQQQAKPVAEPNGNQVEASPKEVPDTKNNAAAAQVPAATPQETLAGDTAAADTAYEAWLHDACLPAPFTVRTENPPGPGIMNKYTKNFGTWQLGDLPSMERSAFCGETSHCDVPREQFPTNAWQSDSQYVAKFLDEADKLVDRARNAILAEYGKTPKQTELFDLTFREDLTRRELKGLPENGGWTTKRSIQGLSRRLLHAIMTRDTFTFVLGGHSAAAGHG